MDPNIDNQPRLADYIRPVWQRKWLVLLIVVVATGATYLKTSREPNVYDSGTLVFYQPGGDPLNGGASFTTDRTVQDVAALLYAQNTAVAVAHNIGYRGTAQELIGQVTISDETGEDFVAIDGTAGAPAEAARIANGYARELVTSTNSSQAAAVNEEIQGLRKQLAQTGTTQSDTQARQTLATQISTLEVALDTPTGTRQVSPAVAPSSPTSPQPERDAVFAFVLSLALAIGVAFGLDRFDRRLKQPEDLAQHYGLPLLGAVGHSSDPTPRRDEVMGIGPGFHEAVRLLQTNLRLLTLDAPPQTIIIVSAVPGEGKSTMVRNLAITLAESGNRVAVVEADLRRPMQSGLFGLPAGPGLTEVLTGLAELEDVLHAVPVDARGVDTLAQITAADNGVSAINGYAAENGDAVARSVVTVLLAGSQPPNPATVLESDRVTEVLDQLKAMYDVVILDSAPLLSVTDSVPLVRYADATLIVGRVGLTTRDNVRRLNGFLERMPDARVVGVIANDVSQLDSGGYGYGYGYGYGTKPDALASDIQPTNTPTAKPAKHV